MSAKRTPFNKDQLDQIEMMAAVGLNLDQMSAIMNMNKKTFERHLDDTHNGRVVLEKGRSKAIFQVGKTAYQQAISGKVPAMTMFYLKCRAGWKETQEIEITQDQQLEQKKKELQSLIDAIKNDIKPTG